MSDPTAPELVSVQQAIGLIDQTPVAPRRVRVPLAQAEGMRLAEELRADRDYPPFEKSLMDGYAVRCADVQLGSAELRVVGEIAAGQWSDRALGAGETMAIMTGAPMPPGADGVVPVENVERRVATGDRVRIVRSASPERFVVKPASDCPAGRVVLLSGILLGPAQVAVAASIGAAEVQCFARPRVAILGTGDEIVPIDQTPGRSQIRDSNTPMLAALLRRLGCEVAAVENARDDPALLRAAIVRGMAHDALFITGGMSMGVYDFVPALLAELGVELKITKLRIKPGKPFVFGIGGEREEKGQRDSGAEMQIVGSALELPLNPSVPSSLSPSAPQSRRPFIFGLPGNPVSAYVCTLRLASRLLVRMAGGMPADRWITGRLDTALPANGPREFYQPAALKLAEGHHSEQAEFATITPLAWKGSADIFTLAAANALLVRAENSPAAPKGTLVQVLEI